jgi:hypothetical protein
MFGGSRCIYNGSREHHEGTSSGSDSSVHDEASAHRARYYPNVGRAEGHGEGRGCEAWGDRGSGAEGGETDEEVRSLRSLMGHRCRCAQIDFRVQLRVPMSLPRS